MDFRPSLFSAALETVLLAILGAMIGFAYGYFMRGAMETGLFFACAISLLMLLFYFGRFLWMAPSLIHLDDDGIEVNYRTGRHVSADWSEISSGCHESKTGLRWNLKIADRQIIIRDDGLNTTEWDEFSKCMTHHLKQNGIEHRATGLAIVFAEDDDPTNSDAS